MITGGLSVAAGIMGGAIALNSILTELAAFEGERRGYEKAAAEYDAAFRRMEREYQEVESFLNQTATDKREEISKLIEKLQELNRQKEILEQELKKRASSLSKLYNISDSSVCSFLDNETFNGIDGTLLDLIYSHKLQEAEAKSYSEARKLYNEKLSELRDNLNRLKNNGDKGIQELTDVIADALEEISDVEAKVAELEIALDS